MPSSGRLSSARLRASRLGLSLTLSKSVPACGGRPSTALDNIPLRESPLLVHSPWRTRDLLLGCPARTQLPGPRPPQAPGVVNDCYPPLPGRARTRAELSLASGLLHPQKCLAEGRAPSNLAQHRTRGNTQRTGTQQPRFLQLTSFPFVVFPFLESHIDFWPRFCLFNDCGFYLNKILSGREENEQ